MPISVYDVNWNHPAKTVQVYTDTVGWVRAKKVKVYDGATWVLSWVHPVTDASLSLSKSSVTTNETYNVILTSPGGFPEGTKVTFRFTGYSWSTNPAEGATTATLPSAQHATAGAVTWYADVETKGGTTTFGPVTQSVGIVASTVSLTAPTWVLSASQSGSGGSATISQAAFTVTLSNPGVVTNLSLQLSYAGGAWTEYKAWTNPAATSNHSITFNTTGAWKARAVATQSDASLAYSSERSITCYKKSLVAAQSDASLDTNQVLTLTASHTGDAVAQATGYWDYMLTSDGIWHLNWSANNPQTWSYGSPLDIQWRWRETFSEGSTIISNVIRTIVSVPPPTDVVVNGGHCHNIQAGMNTAVSQGKNLKLTGSFYLNTNVYIPSNLYITATGAVFYCNSNSAAPGAVYNAGRFKNDEKGGAAGYGQAGGFTIDGGTFDGNGEGTMTFSHSPGYVIKNARFYRYCSSSNTGHAIEINSSGGADNVNGPYTVQILNNTFHGTDRGQRSNSNDEPVHYDWNWAGSGGSLPNWSPGDSISESTQVMCHNVLIQGNTFHRASESAPWAFALCAIGGHDSSDPDIRPTYRHNHFLINSNVIHGAVGSTGTSPNKGAIHLFRGRQFTASNNTLYGGVQKRYLTAEDTGDVGYCTATGNTSANPTLTSPNGITIEG